ncbi:type II secretion system F family protein [Kitasatospora sp. NBC_00374]|uniref:type II secretion system F family protein n=1 Tax=Kitasatospora sp. NBC_00374 TaxID=2975964 RepID=UPI0032498FDB
MPPPDRLVPLVAALVAPVVFGLSVGVPVGVMTGVALWRWMPRARSPAARRAAREQDRLVRQLPLTADLLAACLGSCPAPDQAVAAVARSVDAPMSSRLEAVVAQLSLGASPEAGWGQLAVDCPPLAPLARCLVRTSLSGAPPVEALSGLAHAHRAAASRAAHTRARRAGVLATAPLGACFLPAFVLIGVVPVVIGLTAHFTQRL